MGKKETKMDTVRIQGGCSDSNAQTQIVLRGLWGTFCYGHACMGEVIRESAWRVKGQTRLTNAMTGFMIFLVVTKAL